MEERVGIHKINLVDRTNIYITGVIKVLSSNNSSIILKLKESDLIINGNNLSIENFSDGNINICGTLDSLKYSKQTKIKENFLKRIFK